VESYQSLYLKAHHPLEFLVAVANNFGGFYRTEFYLHEAKRAGAVIEAPCVNMSGEWCSLMRTDRRIHLGLAHIKGLTSDTVHAVLDERRRHGPFTDLQDLLRRVPLELEQARLLVRAGALRFTGRSKPQLLWDLALLHRPARVGAGLDLFTTRVEEPALPPLHHHPLADAYDELELLGFPLCDPFALVDETADTIPTDLPHIGTRDMPQHIGRRVTMRGYLIHVKTTSTHHGQQMTFGSFIDPAGDFWDSTQFPQVAARHPFRGRGVYLLAGVVEEEFGHCALRTEWSMKLPWKPDPRYGAK
jgi:DNA polymerase III alpha subunit